MKTTKQMATVIEKIAHETGTDLSKLGAHIKVENGPYMPLCIETIGDSLVSVAHYFEQNGDLVADPDMVFFTGYGLEWVPVSAQMAFGTYHHATEVEDGQVTKFYPRLQAELASFANMWAHNIRDQGFVEAAQKQAYNGAKQH